MTAGPGTPTLDQLQDRRGRLVGIEVKAAATVRQEAFSGLSRLVHACGDRYIQGIVLYDHDQTIPFGDRLRTVPLSALWT